MTAEADFSAKFEAMRDAPLTDRILFALEASGNPHTNQTLRDYLGLPHDAVHVQRVSQALANLMQRGAVERVQIDGKRFEYVLATDWTPRARAGGKPGRSGRPAADGTQVATRGQVIDKRAIAQRDADSPHPLRAAAEQVAPQAELAHVDQMPPAEVATRLAAAVVLYWTEPLEQMPEHLRELTRAALARAA